MLNEEVGAYEIIGADAGLAEGEVFDVQSGAYSMNGSGPSLLYGRVCAPEEGDYYMAGLNCGLFGPPVAPVEQGEREGGGGGAPPPDPYVEHELELFRGPAYNAGVQGQVPPAVIAAKNLTTTQHPHSRPSTIPGLPWKKPT